MKNNFNSNSSTAFRILYLICLFYKGSYSLEEICQDFSNSPYISRYFTNEAILKYINTLKLAGFEIEKDNSTGKYKLLRSPLEFEFKESNIIKLVHIKHFVESLHQAKILDDFNSFVDKLFKLGNRKYADLYYLSEKDNSIKKMIYSNYDKNKEQIYKIEKYIQKSHKINILYKLPFDKIPENFIIEPKNIQYENNNVFIGGYNPITGELQRFILDYIIDIKQLPQRTQHKKTSINIVYKLKGRVAKGYIPYDNEEIISQQDNEILVKGSIEEKNTLFQRLLRYGNSCEIISPEYIKKQYIEMVKNILSNYV